MSRQKLHDALENIVIKNSLLTEGTAEERDFKAFLRTLEEPELPSVTFRPLPGICVKCRTETGEKAFINVCHTKEIPPPDDLSEEQLFRIIAEEAQVWCIPMVVGRERFEEAKDGTKCPTYDVVLNTEYFEKCQKQKVFLSFTIMGMISRITEKHNRSLKSEYTILQNRKVMGKLQDHRALKRDANERMVSKPLIEEISSSQLENEQSRDVINSGKEEPPRYVLLRRPKNEKVEQLVGYFKIPSRLRIKDIRVDVCDDRIIVEAPRTNYLVDVFVPYTLDQDRATASMDQTVNVLRLDIPVI